MNVRDILDACENLPIFEKRCMTEDYGEIVFFSEDVDRWNEVLRDFFGTAVKPQGVQPTQSDLQVTSEYGGIQVNQTLLKKEDDTLVAIAMFWPWSNMVQTTLKLAVMQKKQ